MYINLLIIKLKKNQIKNLVQFDDKFLARADYLDRSFFLGVDHLHRFIFLVGALCLLRDHNLIWRDFTMLSIFTTQQQQQQQPIAKMQDYCTG